MMPPIECGLGYRSRNKVQPLFTFYIPLLLVLNPNPTLKLKLTLTLTLALKVKITYAVQNDTELKFNRVLYIAYKLFS